ncbi:hypothetical protein GCM10009868_25230 [Terrabacter aerolatus]|uniref:Uncharacterized protein n=1 Tax=Terrabacter aerolatus TaxID=422442 RepID=A0A512D170_9MICO|nr:hypothetical protein [Terrabacter aerolatus]GEO30212.1 hypothetical protein TAE01_20220 [Terrabacter aerolatus]
MGDRVGLIVMLAVVVILVVGLLVVAPRSARRGRDSSESLNGHRDDTERARLDHPEGAERSHLVGNPPVDTITSDGWGVARPGEGAELDELPEDVHPELHEERGRRHRH